MSDYCGGSFPFGQASSPRGICSLITSGRRQQTWPRPAHVGQAMTRSPPHVEQLRLPSPLHALHFFPSFDPSPLQTPHFSVPSRQRLQGTPPLARHGAHPWWLCPRQRWHPGSWQTSSARPYHVDGARSIVDWHPAASRSRTGARIFIMVSQACGAGSPPAPARSPRPVPGSSPPSPRRTSARAAPRPCTRGASRPPSRG